MKTPLRLVTLVLLVVGLLIATGRARAADDATPKTSQEDLNKEFEAARAKAEKGDARAQNIVGVCYDNGRGVEKSYVEAVKWYRKAAEQNHAEAQFNLAVRHDFGRGVKQDYVEAAKWYRKASEQNYAEAQSNLGGFYYYGRGVEKDYVEAVKWYRKAAEQNYASAQFELGLCYNSGHGVEKDYAKAYAWFNLAAGKLKLAATVRDGLEKKMSSQQVGEAQKRTKELRSIIDAKMNVASK